MQQKQGNKSWLTTMVICLGSAALVTGAVNALTLDSSILRDIPYFQKFLITTDGDTSSSSSVELSGSDNQAIKLPGMVGTNDVLIAPGGTFSHTSDITGSSFSSGSLTPDDFGFDIVSYYLSYLGGGGFNDGSCPAGEAISSYVAGDPVCSPVALVSSIPTPLCSPGTSFIGWLSVGIPDCSGATGGLVSAGGSELWAPSSITPFDIFYSTGENCNNYEPTQGGQGGLGESYVPGEGGGCGGGVGVGLDTPLVKLHVSSPSETNLCNSSGSTVVSTTVHGWVYTLGGTPMFPSDPSWGDFVVVPNCICLNPDPAYPGKCMNYVTGNIFLNGPMPSNPDFGDPCKQLYMSGGIAHLEYWSEGIEYVHKTIINNSCACNLVPSTGYLFVQLAGEYPSGSPGYSSVISASLPMCACETEDPSTPGKCLRYAPGAGPYPSYPGEYIVTNDNEGDSQCKEMFVSGGVNYVSHRYGGMELGLGTKCEIDTGSATIAYNYSFVEGLPVGMRCPCDTDVNSIDAACSSPDSFVQPYPAIWIHAGTNSCYDFNLGGINSVRHTLTVTYSSGGTPEGGTVNYNPLPNTILPLFTGTGSPYPPAGYLVPRCSCDLDETTYDCVSFEMEDVGPHCMDVSSVFSYTGGSFAYTSFEFFPANLFLRGAISTISYGSTGGATGTSTTPTFRVDNEGLLQAPYQYDPGNGGGFDGYHYTFSRLIANPSGTPSVPSCSCDVSSTAQDCGGGGSMIDSHAPLGYLLNTPIRTCYDNYSTGGSAYMDAYTSNGTGTILGYFRPVTSPVIQSSVSMGVPSCSCDVDPTSEDCVIVHPTMIGSRDLLGATPLFPPYDSPAVTPAVDMIADAVATPGNCYDEFTSGGTTLYHTFGTQQAVYVPVTGASAPNAHIAAPSGGAGVIGATTIPYNGATVFVIGARVGINTDTPYAALDIVGNVMMRSILTPGFSILSTDALGNLLTSGSLSSIVGEQWVENLSAGVLSYMGGPVGIGTDTPGATLHVNGDILTDSTYIVSDRNVKTNIQRITNALNNISGITGYTFRWKSSLRDDVGILAQEIANTYPYAVKTFEVSSRDFSGSVSQGGGQANQAGQQQGQQGGDTTSIVAVEYPNLLAAVIEAIKELDERIMNAGAARLAAQQDQIAYLELRIAALESGETRDMRHPSGQSATELIENIAEDICNGTNTQGLTPQNITRFCDQIYAAYLSAKSDLANNPEDSDLQRAYTSALNAVKTFFNDNGIQYGGKSG